MKKAFRWVSTMLLLAWCSTQLSTTNTANTNEIKTETGTIVAKTLNEDLNKGYDVNVPTLWLSFKSPTQIESINLPPQWQVVSAGGASSSIDWSKTLFVWWMDGAGKIYFNQYPYHVSDGIDDYTITKEQKNDFLKTWKCPWQNWICSHKQVWKYDVLFTYGIDGGEGGGFVNMHIFILSAEDFVYISDSQIKSLLKKEKDEEATIINQKASQLWLQGDEEIYYSNDIKEFKNSLLQQRLQHPTWAIGEAIQYAQNLIDSMQAQ